MRSIKSLRLANKSFLNKDDLSAAFSLPKKAQRKKRSKRNAKKGGSPLVRGEEGYSPSPAQAFEKA